MMDKETIKQFLKPDWRKNLIFTLIAIGFAIGIIPVLGGNLFNFLPPILIIIFFVVFVFVLSFPYAMCAFSIGSGCIGGSVQMGNSMASLSGLLIMNVIALSITAAEWWIISCLVLFIYDKFKSRKP